MKSAHSPNHIFWAANPVCYLLTFPLLFYEPSGRGGAGVISSFVCLIALSCRAVVCEYMYVYTDGITAIAPRYIFDSGPVIHAIPSDSAASKAVRHNYLLQEPSSCSREWYGWQSQCRSRSHSFAEVVHL